MVCAAIELDVVEVDDAAEDDNAEDEDAFSLPPQAVATVSSAVSPIPTLKIRTTFIVFLHSMSYLYGTHHLHSNIYCHRCRGGGALVPRADAKAHDTPSVRGLLRLLAVLIGRSGGKVPDPVDRIAPTGHLGEHDAAPVSGVQRDRDRGSRSVDLGDAGPVELRSESGNIECIMIA